MKKLILLILLIPGVCFALTETPDVLKTLAEAYDYLQVKLIAIMICMVILIIMNALILYQLNELKKK